MSGSTEHTSAIDAAYPAKSAWLSSELGATVHNYVHDGEGDS